MSIKIKNNTVYKFVRNGGKATVIIPQPCTLQLLASNTTEYTEGGGNPLKVLPELIVPDYSELIYTSDLIVTTKPQVVVLEGNVDFIGFEVDDESVDIWVNGIKEA